MHTNSDSLFSADWGDIIGWGMFWAMQLLCHCHHTLWSSLLPWGAELHLFNNTRGCEMKGRPNWFCWVSNICSQANVHSVAMCKTLRSCIITFCHSVICLILQNNQGRKTRYFSLCVIFWPEMRFKLTSNPVNSPLSTYKSCLGVLACLHCLSIISYKCTAYYFLIRVKAYEMKQKYCIFESVLNLMAANMAVYVSFWGWILCRYLDLSCH